ncbi:hypothetical protein LCGC14_2876640 [marine sediment metagenome]|uniref:Uncharacterized protein n=1 Tax=marine sediment metagenome TaxID=412755 RepID=A0A0F8Y1I8_9ZZZZ
MDWITLIGIAATLAVSAIGIALRFAVRQALDAKQAAAGVELDLANFKTEVAKDYATGRALDKVQERIMGELEKLNKKFDRLFEGRDGR